MSKLKDRFLFICQDEEDPYGSIVIATKDEVNNIISDFEQSDSDLTFKVIGRIPLEGLTLDFPSSRIQWYTQDEKPKELVDTTIVKIIQRIK